MGAEFQSGGRTLLERVVGIERKGADGWSRVPPRTWLERRLRHGLNS